MKPRTVVAVISIKLARRASEGGPISKKSEHLHRMKWTLRAPRALND
jgi:hypothetical protein